MDRHRRQQVGAITDEVDAWIDSARSVLGYRALVNESASAAVGKLRHAVIEVGRGRQVDWRVLVLRPRDGQRLGALARQAHLPAVTDTEHEVLTRLSTDAAAAAHDVKAVRGARRFLSGSKKRDAAELAAEYLTTFREWGHTAGIPDVLRRLEEKEQGAPREVPLANALVDWVGLSPRIADLGTPQEVVDAAIVEPLPKACSIIKRALRREEEFRAEAVAAGEAVRRHEVGRLLADMPVDRLRDATRDRLRIGPLTDAGISTVQGVLDYGPRLEQLPGVGATTAARMRGAAQTLRQTTYDEMPVRVDIQNRSELATQLLRRLGAWDAMRTTKNATADLTLTDALQPLARALDFRVSHLIILSCARPSNEFAEAVQAVVRRAKLIEGATSGSPADDPWDDFLARPADYFAMLAELGFIAEDEQKTHGDLPDDIVEAVRKLELDTQYFSASLRGYQSFGARFAIVQRKVIIGDEMGLGKTIEALAVLAHLSGKGARHAVVVCPAAVVTNWIREIRSKSALRPHRVHGPGRATAIRNFIRNGGVAVTTFETLAWLEPHLLDLDELACVVIDEAHYIKNPAAKRSRRAEAVIGLANHAMLLTGTPLENRIDEFRNLVGYLRPDLVVDATELSPRRFRRQVAPAYLRRNQEDVLTELPELVEVDDWLPLSKEDAAAYRAAVTAGNFMAMRQAAMANASTSMKMQRLREIVDEAKDNGRRVIVFSHFRRVLNEVALALPGNVFGPLTGSVAAASRQVMVDHFSAARHGAVLVSQIVAGGVGLNIQAASVVVICEPQLKPTTEWQAIARARRMGQLETVQVHRLLSENGVDQRITEILARKREIFDEFARISETADSAPEAFDVSEADLAREVIAAERERLFSHTGPTQDEDEAV